MKIINIFGEYEEVQMGKMRSKLDIKKIDTQPAEIPQDILTHIYTNPEKKYYTISEVSTLFGVKASALRYWEVHFKEINPSKNERGVRRFSRADIEAINKIHYFLKIKKWTIKGTQEYLQKNSITETKQLLISQLESIKKKLIHLSKEMSNA